MELLVLLTMLAILVGAAYPRLASIAAVYRLDGAARNLAIDLQKARGRAIAEGRCFRMTFDHGARTYQTESSVCGTGIYTDEGAAQQIHESGSITIADPDDPGSPPVIPEFDPSGKATTESVIRVFDDHGGARSVFVQSTGRVHVE